ncbi:MAG: ADP-dependent glucokinase/phosphofructokinase, partial [Bacteroidota bacterium]|nr:ADP-dependent glucokinase/phosphofructokinase [Bacteroidota bacterium]
MTNEKLKDLWFNHYKSVQKQLDAMSEAKGLISAFNANIDAVIKVSGKEIERIISDFSMNTKDLLLNGQSIIKTNQDAIRGLIKCFKAGIAEEWLIEDINVFNWLKKNIAY